MTTEFVLNAELREGQGKGASRRLRREGKVPGILYGAGKEPVSIALSHNELARQLANEAFYSQVLTVQLGKAKEKAVLRDLHRHPAKPVILHLDLQRVSETEVIRVHVPLHFLNEETSVGVKAGGLVSHHLVEVEVQCLPKNLPEYIEVDLAGMEIGGIVHLSDLKLPKAVDIVELLHGTEHDNAVVSIHKPRGSTAEAEEEPGADEPEDDASAA
jgi:large subunit ribosomal protein L25